MAIEFRCTQCGKLLRTGDTTAGKQAKCPACGTVVTIPDSSTAELPLAPLPAPAGESWGPPQQAAGGAIPGFSENPFASPSASSFAPTAAATGSRTGPPWERDRPSVSSFIETVKQTYTSTALLFSDMRREGGLGAPLGFAIVGGMIGGIVAGIFQVAFQSLGLLGQGGLPGGGNPAANAGALIGGGVMGLVCIMILLPLFIAIGLLINAGIVHLMLMMLGGAKYPFETTFRTIAYSAGSASLWGVIPLCGPYINFIVQLVFVIIGLTKTQEISGGKAAAAVLLPFFVCCGIAALSVFAIIGLAAAGAAGGKGF